MPRWRPPCQLVAAGCVLGTSGATSCWLGRRSVQAEACCRGLGDPLCFNGSATFERCCQGQLLRPTTLQLPQCPPPDGFAECSAHWHSVQQDGSNELNELLAAYESDDKHGGTQLPFMKEGLVLLEILTLLRCVAGCDDSYYPRDWETLCHAFDLYMRRNEVSDRSSIRNLHRTCLDLFLIQNATSRYEAVAVFAQAVYSATIQDQIQERKIKRMHVPNGPRRSELFRRADLDSTGLCHPEQLPQPTFAGQAHQPWQDVTGAYTSHLSMPQLMLDLVNAGVKLSGLVINLGANNGACYAGHGMYDPANCLAAIGWGGVFVEARLDLAEYASAAFQLSRAGPRKGFTLEHPVAKWSGWHSFMENGRAMHKIQTLWENLPRNKAAVLNEVLVPEKIEVQEAMNRSAEASGLELDDVDLLKIDVDGGDCAFAVHLLYSRPKLIHLEVRGSIPPPFAYFEDFNHSQFVDGMNVLPSGKWTGCSLSAAVEVLKGYRLLQLEFTDGLFVREDLVHIFPLARRDHATIWRLHYFCNPAAMFSSMPLGWADPALSLKTRLKWLQSALAGQGPVYVSPISDK